MIEYNQSQNTDSSEADDLSFKVIGVGGAGANVLDRLALEGSDDAQLLVLNTDIRKLSSSVSSQKVQLGSTLLKGMGTGGDPDLGKQAAVEASEEIREAIRGNDMVFVCVGLGGGTGSGAAPEVCRIAREEGVFLVSFTTLPFEFEGARRMQQALDALKVIESYSNAVVTFDNDRMGELIVPKDGVTQAFAAADKIISQSIRATMNIVSKPGIIRIGMDDLLTALNNNNSRCLFGYGQAKGDNRALDAVEQTLNCPLLDNGKLLNEARNVLIQVSGSDSMTLLEVQTVMKEITTHLKPSAHVLFGTGTDQKLGSSLAVTVVSSLDGEAMSGVGTPSVEGVSSPAMREDDSVHSPLAAAVTAAAAAAIGEASNIVADQSALEGEADEDVEEESNIVPIAPLNEPAASGEEEAEESGLPQFSSEGPDPFDTNPIANAVQEASVREMTGGDGSSREVSESVVQPRPLEPKPLVQPEPQPQQVPVESAPAASAGEGVQAQIDEEQTIALSRIVPGQTTQRILNRPKPSEGPVQPDQVSASQGQPVPGQNVTPMPSPEEQMEQQKEILHLDSVEAKGRFAQADPTIVDGEDLDVPTFLRKKG